MIISRTDKGQININLKHFSIERRKIVLHCLSVRCTIDNELSFSDHISIACKKSSEKVGVILRLRNIIPTNAKLQHFYV